METLYEHAHTGSVATQEDWELSYAPEELEERGLTDSEAFAEDEGVTLLELDGKPAEQA